MRRAAFFVVAGLTFAVAPFTPRLGPALGSAALVALAVALSVAASATISAFSVAGGAIGGFAFGTLFPFSPPLAGAVLAALAFGERTSRVRTYRARVLHVLLALGAGAIAGGLALSFALAPIPVRGVAAAVMAVLLSVPILVPADDPLAHALELHAADLGGPSGDALREAAELRRVADEELLDPSLRRPVRATYAALLRLGEARVRLGRTPVSAATEKVVARLDQRIADHVRGLRRAHTAADAAEAAVATLHEAGLRSVETAGDSLEEVSRALVETEGAGVTEIA